MKNLPDTVLEKLQSDHVTFAHLLSFELENPFYFTDAGFDIEHDGQTYTPSSAFEGLDSLSRHAEIRVGEVSFSFSMTNGAITQTILGTDVYKRAVTVQRVYLSEDYQVLHVEPVWRGTVSGKSDDDSKARAVLKVSSRWAKYEGTNPWRSTPKSHHKRYAGDDCFQYAAKASDTIYWAGTAGG